MQKQLYYYSKVHCKFAEITLSQFTDVVFVAKFIVTNHYIAVEINSIQIPRDSIHQWKGNYSNDVP